MHQHRSIASWDQSCQDSGMGGPAQFQLHDRMPHQYVWHWSGDRGSALQESRCAFVVCSKYHFEYYQQWDTVARHDYHLQNWSNELCWMHICLAQPLVQQDANLAYPTANCPYSCCCIFVDYLSHCCAPVQNRGAPEMGEVPKGTVCDWRYPCSIMFQTYVKNPEFNYRTRAQSPVSRGAFAGHLPIELIRC